MSPADSEMKPLPLPPTGVCRELSHLHLKVPLMVSGTSIADANVDRRMDTAQGTICEFYLISYRTTKYFSFKYFVIATL